MTTEFGFVPVRFEMSERLLLRGDGPTIAPVTLPVINGSVLRGVLAQRCAGADRLDRVIVSGDIAAAPGFPVVRHRDSDLVALPAPRTLVRVLDDYDEAELADGREPHSPARQPESVRGLVAFTAAAGVPARLRRTTGTRLARSRRGGATAGMGPISFTVLEEDHVFEARFRVRGDAARQALLRRDLVDLLDTAARGGELLTLGSGADGSYGGEATVRVLPISDEPEPRPPRSTEAGERVDLVLRSPALVVGPDTGAFDPAALGHHVRLLLAAHGIDARVEAVSLGRERIGGAHAGYGRMRPAHWGAAAGSVVTVTVDTGIGRDIWRSALAGRVGERVVDGLGIVGMLDALDGLTLSEPAESRTPPPGAVTTADPLAGEQLALLQHHLFQATADRWVEDTAHALVSANNGAALGVSLLGRLRETMSDPPALRALLADVAAGSPAQTPTPVMKQLTTVRIGACTLHEWLSRAADPDRAVPAWDALPEAPRGRGADELGLVTLGDKGSAADWLTTHRHAVVVALAGAFLLALGHVPEATGGGSR
ncbi:hypothetical protein [Nocardia thailandica]